MICKLIGKLEIAKSLKVICLVTLNNVINCREAEAMTKIEAGTLSWLACKYFKIRLHKFNSTNTVSALHKASLHKVPC